MNPKILQTVAFKIQRLVLFRSLSALERLVEKLPFTLRKMWNAIETDIRSGINWRQATQVYEKPANFEERMDRFQAGVLNGSNYVQAMLSAIKAEPLQEFVELESEVRNGGDWKQKYKWETQSDLGRKALTWHVDLLKKGLSSEEAKAFTILWGYLKLPRVTSSVSSQNPTAAPPTPTFLATPGLSNK